MSETNPRYEARARRLLSVVRANPGLGMNELVRKTCMRRESAKETVDAMLAGGLLMLEEDGNKRAFHPGPQADEFAADVAAEKLAASADPELHTHTAPAGYRLRGVSSLIGADGQVKQSWVKTEKDRSPEDLLEVFAESVAALGIKPSPVIKQTVASDVDDLLTVYPMGDPHLGMLSWHAETGTDFDLKIAEHNLCAAVDRLVTLAPASKKALIVDLGDFLHADNLDATTARSGHSLDVDSRWSKVMRVGVLAMTRCIDRALEKHAEVHVIIEIGNHNDHSALMMSICLSHYYRNNPRAFIDTSPSPFHWFEFGKCLFGVTHGHNTKPADLPGIMAADMPEAWGRTKHRYWLCGHIHHEVKKEFPGCIVEAFRTLAARDFWHHSKGYRAGRGMVCDVFHREHGRVLRHEVGVEALR